MSIKNTIVLPIVKSEILWLELLYACYTKEEAFYPAKAILLYSGTSPIRTFSARRNSKLTSVSNE